MKNTESQKWFVNYYENQNLPVRLFCFPFAGGGASAFRNWHQMLKETCEVYSLQLPGRENRLAASPITTMQPILEQTAEAIFPLLDKPFVFFGHSMGALIAFELTHFLRKHYGKSPDHLFVSSLPAPLFPIVKNAVSRLSDAELCEHLAKLNGTPKEVLRDQELLQLLFPVIRADYQMCETYLYESREPLDIPLTALGGTDDYNVSEEELRGWSQLTTSTFQLHRLAGDHFYLNNSLEKLLGIIRTELKSRNASHRGG